MSIESNPQGNLAAQITDLLSQGESSSLEFKNDLRSKEQAAELIAAMANSGGGAIVVGVDDRGGPVGLSHPERSRRLAEAAASAVWPAVGVTTDEAEVGGEHLVVVGVPGVGDGPVLAPRGALVRRGAQGNTEPLPGWEVAKVLETRQPGSTSEQQLAEMNRRLLEVQEGQGKSQETIDRISSELQKARTWQAQLPGWLVSGVIGAVLGAAVTAGLTALLG